MAKLLPGRFYEFHAERITSRPGQPITSVLGSEIGPEVSRENAARQVREGMDVYTLNKQDAYRLAANLHSRAPRGDPAENEAYYPHYHPGNLPHKYDATRPGRKRCTIGPGHVFFGTRGQTS